MPEPLGPEPNPQSIPNNPRGAIDPKVRAKVGAALLLGMIGLMGVWVYFTHKSHTALPVGPTQSIGKPPAGRTPPPPNNDGAADAYQKGFSAGAERARALDGMGMGEPPPPVQHSSVPLVQTAAETLGSKPKSLAEMDHDAAFADNVVEVRETPASPTDLPPPVEQSKPTVQTTPPNPSLPAGTVIEGVLANKLDGEFTGPVVVQVSADVYRPHTREVVIPQGGHLLGEATRVGAQNQQRLAVVFHRALWYDDAGQFHSISLDVPALDQEGAAALHGKVNNHYMQIFGSSLALGAIGGLAQIGNGSYGGLSGYNSGTEFRNGITESMAQSSQQALSRFLNRLPTVTVRPGTIVRIILTQDLAA